MPDNYINKSPKAAIVLFIILLGSVVLTLVFTIKNPPQFSIDLSQLFTETPTVQEIEFPNSSDIPDGRTPQDPYEQTPIVNFGSINNERVLIANQESLEEISWCQPYIDEGNSFLDISNRKNIPKKTSDFEYTVTYNGETYHFMSYFSIPVGQMGKYSIISHAFTCQSQSDYILEVKDAASGVSSLYPYVLRHLQLKETTLFTAAQFNGPSFAPKIAAFVLSQKNNTVTTTGINKSVCAQNNTSIGINYDFGNYFMTSYTEKDDDFNSIICIVQPDGKVRNAFLGNLPWREVKMLGKDRYAPSFTQVSIIIPTKRNDYAVFTEESEKNVCGFFTIPADKPDTEPQFTYVKEMHVSGVCGMFPSDIDAIK